MPQSRTVYTYLDEGLPPALVVVKAGVEELADDLLGRAVVPDVPVLVKEGHVAERIRREEVESEVDMGVKGLIEKSD